MGFILENIFGEVVCALLLLGWALYSYTTRKYNYWQDKKVPYNKPSFPFGSVRNLYFGKRHLGELFDDFYKEFDNEPYFGVYEGRRPTLVLRDPDLVKQILTKDFNYFYDRALFPFDKKKDYITNHLFNMCGEEWRRMRLKLTPTFTSGKMKMMFLLMTKCGDQLRDCLAAKLKDSPEVDVKDVLSRFTLDIIASCAFGLEINSLSDNDSEFYRVGAKIFESPKLSSLAKRLVISVFPFITKIYTPRFAPLYVSDFLTKIVRDTVKYRENNNVNRHDFIDLLIKIRQNKSIAEEEEHGNTNSTPEEKLSTDKSEFTIEEITAQAFVFFAAGFETASSTMTFCLYELARHPEVQDRLHQEVLETLSRHGGLTYAAMQDMPYMEQVINETLRLYASVPVLHRTCTKTYKVPGDAGLVLEKGQRVIVPTYAIHHDPQYYPEPFNFDPERFTAERVRERHPYLHLPFGEGPRMCIGMRFGMLQTKVGLAELISNFEFSLSPTTQIPIVLNKLSFVTQSEKPIKLILTRRVIDS